MSIIRFVSDWLVPEPQERLPDWFFYLCSRCIPLCNSDVLIRLPDGSLILSWRQDKYHGEGWHVPGRILRFQQTFLEAAAQTCMLELGFLVGENELEELVSYECIGDKGAARGHFVTKCFIVELGLTLSELEVNPSLDKVFEPGELAKFTLPPENMLKLHKMRYGKYF